MNCLYFKILQGIAFGSSQYPFPWFGATLPISHLDIVYLKRKPTDFGPLVLRDTCIHTSFIKSLVGRLYKSKICRQKRFLNDI